ncbi:MAG: hypothetical protein IPG44_11695 [Anaerolineales bacterium]|nr:hypothetical protein [Anaerolineales bacterium]
MSYTAGEARVMVEAVDLFGLSKQSMALPVLVTVIETSQRARPSPANPRAQLTPWRDRVLRAGRHLPILLGGRRRISIRAIQEERRAQNVPLLAAAGDDEEAAPAYAEKAADDCPNSRSRNKARPEVEAAASPGPAQSRWSVPPSRQLRVEWEGTYPQTTCECRVDPG